MEQFITEAEREFEENRPSTDSLLANGPNGEESETALFGYKHRENGWIHEVTDWGNIKKFLTSKLSQAYTLGKEEGKRDMAYAIAMINEVYRKPHNEDLAVKISQVLISLTNPKTEI